MVDLNSKIPEYSKIVKNHPSKTDTRVMNWNENLAFHHKKYLEILSKNKHLKYSQPEDKPEHVMTESDNFRIENKYKGILSMKKLDDGSIVVVENLWKNLLNRLPEVLKVNKFGQ
jgi:hypothetical protein